LRLLTDLVFLFLFKVAGDLISSNLISLSVYIDFWAFKFKLTGLPVLSSETLGVITYGLNISADFRDPSTLPAGTTPEVFLISNT